MLNVQKIQIKLQFIITSLNGYGGEGKTGLLLAAAEFSISLFLVISIRRFTFRRQRSIIGLSRIISLHTSIHKATPKAKLKHIYVRVCKGLLSGSDISLL